MWSPEKGSECWQWRRTIWCHQSSIASSRFLFSFQLVTSVATLTLMESWTSCSYPLALLNIWNPSLLMVLWSLHKRASRSLRLFLMLKWSKLTWLTTKNVITIVDVVLSSEMFRGVGFFFQFGALKWKWESIMFDMLLPILWYWCLEMKTLNVLIPCLFYLSCFVFFIDWRRGFLKNEWNWGEKWISKRSKLTS